MSRTVRPLVSSFRGAVHMLAAIFLLKFLPILVKYTHPHVACESPEAIPGLLLRSLVQHAQGLDGGTYSRRLILLCDLLVVEPTR